MPQHAADFTHFQPYAVDPRDYPPAQLSMLPRKFTVDWRQNTPSIPSAFLNQSQFFVYGRYALVEALKCANISTGSVVLMPAYHCRTIVESALHLNLRVRFYPLDHDLTPNIDTLKQLATDPEVQAVLLTHYFGFPNAITQVKSVCSEKSITLIEDCAHAFYGQSNGQTLGTIGDYAISSAWKFMPVSAGAFLRSNTPEKHTTPALQPQPWKADFKAILHLLQTQTAKKTLPEIDFSKLAQQAKSIAHHIGTHPADSGFLPNQAKLAGLRTNLWQIHHIDHNYIAEQRRNNYLHWLNGVRNISKVTPLFTSLPDNVVPYAFPLLTDTQGMTFHLLKLAGIPIWRWEDVAPTPCTVSSSYRLKLLQLPCHQDLSKTEIDWMLHILHGISPYLPGA